MVTEEKSYITNDDNSTTNCVENVIYEEIENKRYGLNYHNNNNNNNYSAPGQIYRTSSFTINNNNNKDDSEDDENGNEDPGNSVYEEMHGFRDDLFETYQIQNIHSRQSSDSLLMDIRKHQIELNSSGIVADPVVMENSLMRPPPYSGGTSSLPARHHQHQQVTSRNNDSKCIYSDVQCHRRNASRSSSSEESTSGGTEYYRANNDRALVSSRSAEDLRSHPLQNYDRETIYSEIVINADSNEITAGRITRESANPILRQNRMSSSINKEEKRALSVQNIHTNGIYSYADALNNNTVDSSSDNNTRNTAQQHLIRQHSSFDQNDLYENHNSFLSSQTSVEDDVYENSRSSSSLSASNTNSLNRKLHSGQQQKEFTTKGSPTKHLEQSMEPDTSVYENINDTKYLGSVTTPGDEDHEHDCDIYEKVFDPAAGWEFETRDRSSSKPINIHPSPRHQVAPFSTSSMSSSMTSSPRGSICSSISSEQTTPMSPPSQPPLLPLSRKRQIGTSSWTDMSAFHGLNYFTANYLGKHCVSKLTRDCIDSSISYVAQRTSLLDMKPVVTEVSHDLIRIGINQYPWDLIESFAIEEIVNFEVIKKNVNFIGIIAGKPGEEATCYVLQSDKATEITDAIRDVFQTASKKKVNNIIHKKYISRALFLFNRKNCKWVQGNRRS